jgi:hypothetical protein
VSGLQYPGKEIQCIIKEAIESELHPGNMNRKGIMEAWKLLLQTLKE